MQMTDMLFFEGNWVDFLIICILGYYIIEAWKAGLMNVLSDFFAFLFSLIIALWSYSYISNFFQEAFSFTSSIANVLGFLIAAGLTETILSFLISNAFSRFPEKYSTASWSRAISIFPAVGEGLLITSFLLILVVGIPISPLVKTSVTESIIGGYLIEKTTGLESQINSIFGGAIQDSLTYLTIRPGSQDSVAIQTDTTKLSVDSYSEIEMLRLLNEERKKRGVEMLSIRSDLVPVARLHAEDMWRRGYFAHISPDGDDVGSRLSKSGTTFTVAGENLALAPTLVTAHNGLMNSAGHRENILEPRFTHVGIGVIDNGIYGKMFVQVFTD